MRVTATIKRKGKVVARSASIVAGDNAAEAIREVAAETHRQAKAKDVANHTGRKAYRKKLKS